MIKGLMDGGHKLINVRKLAFFHSFTIYCALARCQTLSVLTVVNKIVKEPDVLKLTS